VIIRPSRGGRSAFDVAVGGLEQLDQVAVRVGEQDLAPAGARSPRNGRLAPRSRAISASRSSTTS